MQPPFAEARGAKRRALRGELEGRTPLERNTSSLVAASLLALLTACGTTLEAKNYANDCDADSQCVVVTVGDICSCDCQLAAINDRDYDKYVDDIIRTGGCRDPPTCSCGDGIGAICAAGTCQTVALPPSDAGTDQ